MTVIGILFFMFGFVTWLNGSLIPFLQIACELNHSEAFLVTFAFYISYTVMAFPMSRILKYSGYKDGMVLGLGIMLVGALLFVPAALTREYSIFLLALFVLGAGLTLLQTASNPYIVMIGPAESAAVRISIMGILNKAAGVVAPLIFTVLVFQGMSEFTEEHLATLTAAERMAQLSELSMRLITPYIYMAAGLLGLALFVKFSPLKEPEFEVETHESPSASVMHRPQLVLGAITLFFYVGVEVIAGDTIGLFGNAMGVQNFGALTAYTMTFMVLGYLLGMMLIPRWISQSRALALSAIFGLVCVFSLLFSDPTSSSLWDGLFSWSGAGSIPNPVLFVALFGLANALVWPAVWPLALQGLSPSQISSGSALLIMGIAGGAIFPLIYGVLADSNGGPQTAYWIVIPCYLFILFYALKGHRLRSW